MVSKTNTFATLPAEMVLDLNKVDFTKSERDYAIKFISGLMKRSWRETGTIDALIETPKEYFRKAFNGQYLKWLSKLEKNDIISINSSYSNYYNNIYSKSYSINNKYIPPPIMWHTFEPIDLKTVGYSVKNSNLGREFSDIKSMVLEDFKKLRIDYNILLELTRKEVDLVKIELFKCNDEIERETMEVIFREDRREKKYWMSKTNALEKAKSLNRLLIQDENRFYIMDEFEFILMKKHAIYISYQDCITNMEKGNFFASRNSTNNRLDTNLTNMAKVLTDEICKKNNLIQFDLCNSQFAILSDLLEDNLYTEDFEIFKIQSYNGTLYEYIMEKLNIEKRKTAKTMMFELMFSKETFNSPLKKELKKIFPSVVKTVDNYKAEHGYNKFSIMLQKRESEIFIDGIWKKIKKKKLFCITKHDCVIFKQEDSEKIKSIILSEFEKIKFKGKLVEEKFVS